MAADSGSTRSTEKESFVCPECGYSRRSANEEECPQDGRLLVRAAEYRKAPRDRYLGTRLAGKYRIVGILGQGGMSTAVYRGVQESVGREVAIKVVSPTADDHNAMRERFQREAKVIACLQHPNIVTLFDFGVEADGTLFMVQEMVEGKPLSEAIREDGALGLERSVRIAMQVLAALAAAHAKHLIHRDMKPDNIMLSPTSWGGEQVKVLDFGIARSTGRAAAGKDRLTQAGVIFGTPHYMSPEQVTASREISFPSDVYSFGIVMYEMLSGDVPFQADSLVDVLVAQRFQDLPPLPPELAIPTPVEEVIRRATAKDPTKRYAHAAEMMRALNQATGGEALPMTPAPGSSVEPTAAMAVKPLRDRLKELGPEPPRSGAAPASAPRRAEPRGTMVMSTEEQQRDQRQPRAAWTHASGDGSVHSRPTLVVDEEAAALLAQAATQEELEEDGGEAGVCDELEPPRRQPETEELRPPAAPSGGYPALPPIVSEHVPTSVLPVVSPPPPAPSGISRTRPRPPRRTAAPPPASSAVLPWVTLGVGLVGLILAIIVVIVYLLKT